MIDLAYFLQLNFAVSSLSYERDRRVDREEKVELKMEISESLESVEFGPEQAEERVREYFARLPISHDYQVFHLPTLDIAGFYVVGFLPRSTGGISFYFVDLDGTVFPGDNKVFNQIMKRLGVGMKPNVLDVRKFAEFFLLLCAPSYGSIVERFDESMMSSLPPGKQLSEEQFFPPRYSFDERGAHYTFWAFHFQGFGWPELILWSVHVEPDGLTLWARSL